MIFEKQTTLLLALLYNVISFVLATYECLFGQQKASIGLENIFGGNKTNEVFGDERLLYLKMLCGGTDSHRVHQWSCLPNKEHFK